MNAPLPPLRRGACPALSAPMQTGDGLLVRLNLTEGGISPATLAALCEAAARHGNGIVEITARGSFQIRGLTPASAPRLADAANALAIQVREGVPVETSPLAGLDPAEIADPLPLVRAIRAAIADAALSRRLGPKVSVVIDGGGLVLLDDIAADVRVRAVSESGWLVSVGGEALGIADGEDDAVAAVLSLLAGIAGLGTAARGRDLPAAALAAVANRLGIRPTLPPSVLPDISPSRGEIGLQSDPRSPCNAEAWRNRSGRPIPPLVGEMSGRTEGGNVGQIHLGLTALHHDLFTLAIALPFGQCEAAALAALATAAPDIADFRFAPGRRLLALGSREACGLLNTRAAALGFVTDPADPRLSVAACPGAPACASGHFDAKKLGARVADMLPAGFAGTVHVSGCPKGCAHPAPAAFALVGTGAGVALVRSGRAADAPSAVHPNAETALAALRAELHKAAA